ncbi:MAG TPA: sulfite oxidase [Actinomycetes bacterium]|jgi:DMSO/TMAO reductase YedYZ molybdopterin-dependent catalytic subunit|nr:sulfite oxidase [Actinomycetes bacterium]
MTSLSDVSLPSRVAEPGEGIGTDELGLAARNHGIPLELMRHDLTPLGAHYLLTHYDIPFVPPDTFRLEITGAVRRSLTLDLPDLRSRPTVTTAVTMECAGNGRARFTPRPVSQPWLQEAVGTMAWTGTPLGPLLQEAGLEDAVVDVVFIGADHGVERGVEQDYQRSLPVAKALDESVLLAWACNGTDLPPQHGAPLRLVVPGWYGMASVKWLTRVEAVTGTFDGPQMRAYRLRQSSDEVGEALTTIRPRALVTPPGFPDFMSRARVVRPGRVLLEGRAWSGTGTVDAVEVTTDGGATWHGAELDAPVGEFAWRRWTWWWDVESGHHLVSARATDVTGAAQPHDLDTSAWNRGGFANNALQQVPVLAVAG